MACVYGMCVRRVNTACEYGVCVQRVKQRSISSRIRSIRSNSSRISPMNGLACVYGVGVSLATPSCSYFSRESPFAGPSRVLSLGFLVFSIFSFSSRDLENARHALEMLSTSAR